MGGNRAFAIALGVSALIHLSMVTVFSIGVSFQVKTLRYYDFTIVRQPSRAAPPAEVASAADRRVLRPPSLDDLPDLDASSDAPPLALEGQPTLLASLPEVELPTVGFSDLERLRLRQQSLRITERQSSLLSGGPEDSWARFGRGIDRLTDTLSRLPFLDHETPAPPEPELQRVSVPAEGFEVYIEWMAGPRDRELLFSPPIEALFQLDPASLAKPITFVFRVGPDGRVREVLSSTVAVDPDLAVSVATALTKYRFASVPDANGLDQRGALIIAPARTAP